MAKRKSTAETKPTDARRLRQLGSKWKKVLESQRAGFDEQLDLANELYNLVISSKDAQLRIVEQTFAPKSKPKVTTVALTNPRAALLEMLRFCNIWLPLNAVLCLARGCPAFNPPGAPAGKFCFLIGCSVNVCPLPGAARTRCVYLCI